MGVEYRGYSERTIDSATLWPLRLSKMLWLDTVGIDPRSSTLTVRWADSAGKGSAMGTCFCLGKVVTRDIHSRVLEYTVILRPYRTEKLILYKYHTEERTGGATHSQQRTITL